jgi:hypothetical protein
VLHRQDAGIIKFGHRIFCSALFARLHGSYERGAGAKSTMRNYFESRLPPKLMLPYW